MNNWFLFVIASCLACSNPSTTPDPATANEPYRATATLNDSTWFGAAHASKSVSIAGETTCLTNRIDISFITDLPYSGMTPQQTITGCLQACVPTQQLVFYRIPLAVGTYELADLSACAPPQGTAVYSLLLGGDAIINTYGSGTNRTGRLQITAYDQRQNLVEGTFETELVDRTAKLVRFKNGTFKAVIKQ